MDASFYLSCVLIAVTLQAKLDWRRRDQLDVGEVSIGTNLVTAQTASGDGRVDGFGLRFISMALDASRAIGRRIEWNRMNRAKSSRQKHRGQTR